MKLYNIEWNDVDISDYPDFCDAFISYAENENGDPLTEKELEGLDSSDVYEQLMEDMPWL